MFITKKTIEVFTGPKGSGQWITRTYLFGFICIKKVTLTRYQDI